MKGQVYSLITVLIVFPLMMYILFFVTSSQSARYSGLEKVVSDQIYQVERSIERDFGRASGTSCKRALLAVSGDVVENGRYVNDSVGLLTELMIDGTLNGNENFYMENNTLGDWMNAILGVETGFNTNLNHSYPLIENSGGIELKVTVNLSTDVSDGLGIARKSRNMEKETPVSVEGIDDPIFPLNTQGYIRRLVTEYPHPYYALKVVTGTSSGSCSGEVSFDAGTPDPEKILVTENASGVSGFRGVIGEAGDIPAVSCYVVSAPGAVVLVSQAVQQSGYESIYLDSNTAGVWSLPLAEGIENGHYYREDGPDMLKRLEGDLSPSQDGLQTFVSIPELRAQGIPVKETQTRLAFLYFSQQIYNGERVRGLPDWFRIDTEHAATYNLTELLG